MYYFRMMWTHYFRLILGQADMGALLQADVDSLILGQAGMGVLLQDDVEILLQADIGAG